MLRSQGLGQLIPKHLLAAPSLVQTGVRNAGTRRDSDFLPLQSLRGTKSTVWLLAALIECFPGWPARSRWRIHRFLASGTNKPERLQRSYLVCEPCRCRKTCAVCRTWCSYRHPSILSYRPFCWSYRWVNCKPLRQEIEKRERILLTDCKKANCAYLCIRTWQRHRITNSQNRRVLFLMIRLSLSYFTSTYQEGAEDL